MNLSWEVLEGIVKHETEYDVADAAEFDASLRGHLEAQITNVADELAYTAHDLDDGLRSGMITISMLAGMPIWEILLESIQWKGIQVDELTRHRLIRRLIGMEVTDIVDTTDANLRQHNIQSVLELQKLPSTWSVLAKICVVGIRELKDFLYKNLYRHYRVVRMAVKAERIITELFNSYQKEPTILPYHVQVSIS